MFSLKAATTVTHEIEIQRSRFITTISQTTTEEQAREIIATARNRYPDARHHCSAFIIKPEGGNEIGHSNDDGEPSGTAGSPMLEVIRRRQLVNVVAVVTRYFGGILLGAGGLVRAYSSSVANALDLAELVELVKAEVWQVSADYSTAGRLEADIRAANLTVLQVSYSQTVTFKIAVNSSQRHSLHTLVATVGQGQLLLEPLGHTIIEVALNNVSS